MTAPESNEWVIYDGTDPCPYLPGQDARMPLRLPHKPLAGEQLDAALARGDRRAGGYLYRPQCPTCRACQALRVDVTAFEPSRTQQRVLRLGDRLFELTIGEPLVDELHVALFNQHRLERGLARTAISAPDYAAFLTETCCETIELAFRSEGRLVCVAVADRGGVALSAVYCYYDPAFARHSLGTYAIMKQIELCRQWTVQYLYLGLYIAANAHMCYKSRFLPHERLIDGAWRRVERSAEAKS